MRRRQLACIRGIFMLREQWVQSCVVWDEFDFCITMGANYHLSTLYWIWLWQCSGVQIAEQVCLTVACTWDQTLCGASSQVCSKRVALFPLIGSVNCFSLLCHHAVRTLQFFNAVNTNGCVKLLTTADLNFSLSLHGSSQRVNLNEWYAAWVWKSVLVWRQ